MTSMLPLWCLLVIFVVSTILIIVGLSTLPSSGGTIPQDQSTDEYQKHQQVQIIASKGFVITMVGVGLCCVGITGFLIKNYYEEHPRIVPTPPQDNRLDVKEVPPLKSILKNSRVTFEI